MKTHTHTQRDVYTLQSVSCDVTGSCVSVMMLILDKLFIKDSSKLYTQTILLAELHLE